MKKKLSLLLILICFTSVCFAGDFYEKSTQRISRPRGIKSVTFYSDSKYIAIDDIYLKAHTDPRKIPQRYRKLSTDGKYIEEMTAQEKIDKNTEIKAATDNMILKRQQEILINKKMRELAIKELKKDNKLPEDYEE